MNYDIHYEKEVTSTNTLLKDFAAKGAPEGYTLVAQSQTSGRGRLGRSFYSPPGSGLYFSLLLRPRIPVKPAALTCLSAVALAESVQSYDIPCAIKWVNDLYLDNKKAAGILTEGAFEPDGSLSYAIIGIGLNLYLPDNIPSELKSIMTGIFKDGSKAPAPNEVLKLILQKIAFYYEELPDITFWEKYRNMLNCFGRKVSFFDHGILKYGVAEDIDHDFRLIIHSESECFSLERGEVNFI
jgi:BirA family biotin operon repressor/biotin-[acetyl-CoA-carboxylase] ligase